MGQGHSKEMIDLGRKTELGDLRRVTSRDDLPRCGHGVEKSQGVVGTD